VRRIVVAALVGVAFACGPKPAPVTTTAPVEAPAPAPGPVPVISLLGEALPPVPLPPEIEASRQDALARARRAHAQAPEDLEAILWLGRRLAYVGRYHEAIDVYTEGLTVHPDDPRLLRHRGHRFVTVRRFEDALADLQRAAAFMLDAPDRVEEDGLPNAAGVPTGSLYTNVWYHLALAHYLLGDYARAAEAWEACLDAARTDDMRVAATYWRAVTSLRRGERQEALALAARVDPELPLHENFAYLRLLQLFAERIDLDEFDLPAASDLEVATYGYGIGVWHLAHGRDEPAHASFRRVLDTPQWAVFGYLAAESEVARLPAEP
jgi:tetratricopeptide (TPR) repeat protein